MKRSSCFNIGLYRQIFAGISASMGAFAAGGVLGWVTPIIPWLMSADSEIPMTSQEVSWMISSIGFANLITPIPAAFFTDLFGRKALTLFSAPLFASGWLIILYFRSYMSVILARNLQGAAVGIVYTSVPVYLGEIASVEYRGTVTSLFFIFLWAGLLFEYCTGPYMNFTNFTLITFATNIFFLIIMMIQPESPYFCLMKGDEKQALKSLMWFRSSPEEDIRDELESIKKSIKEDQMSKMSWKDVIATPTDRKALYIVLFTAALRTLSGTMPIVTYATENFTIDSNLSLDPNFITILLGVILVIGACFSFITIDWFGRRFLIIMSSGISFASLLVIGIYYYMESQTTIDVRSYSWLAPCATFIYAAFAVAGLHPVNTAYISELFNSNTRATAAALSTLMSTLITFLTLKLYQDVIDLFGFYFNFLMFSAMCLIGAVISYLYLPETKNKTFEEIRKLL